jgi:predicted nucleic acid-binding protein
MASIVVDASVAIQWVLPEESYLRARELLRTYVSGEHDLIAPRVLPEEAASVLARRVRRRQLTPAGAEKAFRFLQAYMPALEQDAELVHEAFRLSLRLQLSLWDCLYLALAIRGRRTLVTADRRLHRDAKLHYPYVELL